jgi:hypothetical protein
VIALCCGSLAGWPAGAETPPVTPVNTAEGLAVKATLSRISPSGGRRGAWTHTRRCGARGGHQTQALARARPVGSRPRALHDLGEALRRTDPDDRERLAAAARSNGFDDRACLEVAHIVGVFNYLTRLADGASASFSTRRPRPRLELASRFAGRSGLFDPRLTVGEARVAPRIRATATSSTRRCYRTSRTI